MRTKLLLLSLAVLVGAVACQPYPPDSGGINNTNTNTFILNPSNPSASPSPGGGAPLPPGSRVALFVVGDSQLCGSSFVQPKVPVKVGCKVFVTATPKDSNGVDIPQSVHGPDCEWTNSDSNIASLDVSGDNEFNATLKGNAPGRVMLTATVKGITGQITVDVVP
jgi:hypothetical protein